MLNGDDELMEQYLSLLLIQIMGTKANEDHPIEFDNESNTSYSVQDHMIEFDNQSNKPYLVQDHPTEIDNQSNKSYSVQETQSSSNNQSKIWASPNATQECTLCRNISLLQLFHSLS